MSFLKGPSTFWTVPLFLILIYSCGSASKVEVDELPILHSHYLQERQVQVWTPNGFPEDGLTYATLYMHDGQMLFDSSLTWNHQEWGVDECLQNLIDEKKIKPCIVVAIWNTKDRIAEYAPMKPLTLLSDSIKEHLSMDHDLRQVRSDDYLKFIVNELKPQIESLYPVSKKREDLFISGSSMGGLISLYALMEYPEVFGGSACLSTHWPLSLHEPDVNFTLAYIQYMRAKLPVKQSTKLYFDHGDQELDELYPALQARVDSFFYNNNTWGVEYMSKAFPGAGHRESFWRERLDVPLEFLLRKD
jgi:enterochelin esterase-like enzyme